MDDDDGRLEAGTKHDGDKGHEGQKTDEGEDEDVGVGGMIRRCGGRSWKREEIQAKGNLKVKAGGLGLACGLCFGALLPGKGRGTCTLATLGLGNPMLPSSSSHRLIS